LTPAPFSKLGTFSDGSFKKVSLEPLRDAIVAAHGLPGNYQHLIEKSLSEALFRDLPGGFISLTDLKFLSPLGLLVYLGAKENVPKLLGITYSRDFPGSNRNVPLMYEDVKHPLDNSSNRLQIFADSDYAADETRRSTMGGVTMLNGGPVTWFSVLGKTIAMSTCEAEVNAAAVADKQVVFKYCPTDLQYADFLTKPLDSVKFSYFRDQILTR
jgi:hypothetical protein